MNRMFNRTISNDYYLLMSTIQKRIAKFVAILLVLFTVASACLPQNRVYGYTYDFSTTSEEITSPEDEIILPNYPTTTDPDFDPSKVEIESELVDERTATSKTFRKIDGTYELVAYDEIIHYFNDGVWKEINNSLVDVGDEVKNKENAFQVNFPKTIDANKQIKVLYGDFAINWKIQNANSSVIDFAITPKTSTDVRIGLVWFLISG